MKVIAPKQLSEFPSVKQSGVRRSRPVSPLSTKTPVLQRQCACGGGCPRCQEKLGLQTKLKISEPGDQYEQEADRIADQVMRMPEPSVQREIEPDEEEEEIVQRAAIAQPATAGVPSIVHEALNSPSQSLDTTTRALMESRFGSDFSQVRVHTDAKAAESAQAVNASAYTVGQDIVFGSEQYSPHTLPGQKLLAHELTHTIQQKGITASAVTPSPTLERGTPMLQRQPIDPSQENRPAPNLGPPVQELPLPPRCGVGMKDGEWFWKCEGIPGLGSTPEIPLDPRDIPKKIDDILKGATPNSPNGGNSPLPGPRLPTPSDPFIPGPVLPPDFWEEFVKKHCVRFPALCGTKPIPAQPILPPFGIPTLSPGILWTDTVLFQQDRPLPGMSNLRGSLTEEGVRALDSIISWLRISSTLQIRLIGHASSEGKPDYNLALSSRRVMLVYNYLKEQGFADRIANPLFSDDQAIGCTALTPAGVWSCGEVGANQEEINSEDRNVRVTFFRNFAPIPSTQLTPPFTNPYLKLP